MASKSVELLAGDDIEGILAVIDNDVLAKPNDLETEFAATVSKIQEIKSESCFLCQNCRKTYKTKRGLNRHQSAEHGDYTKTYEERLPLNIFEQFLTTSKVKLANDQCFESFMGEFSAFVINKECMKNVHKLISNVVLSFKGDAEKFYPAFYKCISDAENPFGGSLSKHASLLLGFELANHVLGYLSGGSLEKDSVVQFKYSSADLNDKEKSIVFYLAGYVFSTFSRRLRFTKKNNQNAEIVQEYLAILAAGKLGDEKQELPEHKLVNTKNRGGLWKVTAEVFEIFCIAEQMFKKHTETCSNKIDGQLITKAVLEDTGVLVNFSKLKSNINYADNEITKNILEDLIHLYIKTRTFSLVRSKMDAHKLLLRKNKARSLRTGIKKSCDTPTSS